jgi:hypothetical protein
MLNAFRKPLPENKQNNTKINELNDLSNPKTKFNRYQNQSVQMSLL